MRGWRKTRVSRAIVALFSLSLLLSACDLGSLNELLDDLQPASQTGRDEPATPSMPRRDAPADPSTPSGGGTTADLSAVEKQVFELLNAERKQAGLAALKLDNSLSSGARAWSKKMATEDFFSHDTSGNFAENIAYGYRTAKAVHDGWMNSSGHRNNRMNSRYSTYGVGVHKNGNTLYYTERFR